MAAPPPRAPFTLLLRGNGETRLNQDVRAQRHELDDAHAFDAQFRLSVRRPAPPRPAEPGPFDTRTAKINCDDVKFAAAAYRNAAEHYDNLRFWGAKLHEPLGDRTGDHLRAEALRELDALTEPTPPIASPGITNRGGEALRSDTREAARLATRGSDHAGLPAAPADVAAAAAAAAAPAFTAASFGFATGPPGPSQRVIGAGRSVPAWDAYTTVTAPFASAALVHAPERDVATRVLESTAARHVSSTFYAASSMSNVRPTTALRPEATTTGHIVPGAGGGVGAGVSVGGAVPGQSASGAPSAVISGLGRAPPGGFSSTLENALRSSAQHRSGGDGARGESAGSGPGSGIEDSAGFAAPGGFSRGAGPLPTHTFQHYPHSSARADGGSASAAQAAAARGTRVDTPCTRSSRSTRPPSPRTRSESCWRAVACR